jgi:hypothetical protein
MLGLLRGDNRVTTRYELVTWDYPTKWVEFNILARIPRLEELGRALGDEIESSKYRGRQLTLVGHSQGGLVIQAYLTRLLGEGKAAKLRDVRQVILFATPNEGSTTGFNLRRLATTFFRNPQETTLRVLNPDVSDMRATIREQIVTASRDSAVTWRVPIHALCGIQDDVVPEASARGPFESVKCVQGTHFSIIKPANETAPGYARLLELLLEPGGHLHRFEIETYDTVIRVEPRDNQIMVTGGKNERRIEFDNYAKLERSVTFAAGNRCKDYFRIRYGTRAGGHVIGHASHPNEAPSADRGLSEDTGLYYEFGFTPEYGETYCGTVEVYKGFDQRERDIHFHLGHDSHYRRLKYTLDLSAYMAAGWRVSDEPTLYLDPRDLEHGELCRNRSSRQAVMMSSRTADGLYHWELQDVWKGITDIVWDVAKSPSSV